MKGTRTKKTEDTPKDKVKKSFNWGGLIIWTILGVVAYYLVVKPVWQFFFRPSVWEEIITITPNYPTTHYSISSDGRCNTSLFELNEIEQDNNCLIWEFADDSSKTVWKEAGLEIALQNGSIMTKPAGAREEGFIDAVINVRSTDKKVHTVKLTMRCPCRE